MSERIIYITEYDKERLMELLTVAGGFDFSGRSDLQSLEEELDRAVVMDPKEIPSNVVTMNSQVEIVDLDTHEKMTFTLVFPRDADIYQGRVSVLAPLGTAVLGYSVGDIIEWEVPAGLRRFKIENLFYQPEAAGDYHL